MSDITDRLYEKAGKMRIPLTGAFELLPLCNLRCKMCYVRKDNDEAKKQGGILPGQFWVDCAKAATDKGLLYPLLTGGEPLLHPDFFDIYSKMLNMGLLISINTNGTLIDRKTSEYFEKHKPRRINLTLYGASEDSYYRCCGDGAAFEKVIRGIEFLKGKRVPVKFNASITEDNIDELEEIMNLSEKYDSPIQVATYMFPPMRRDESMVGTNNRLSPDMAGYAKVKADFLRGDIEAFKRHALAFSNFSPIREIQNAGVVSEKMTCRGGKCSFWIDWKGNLSNCGMYMNSCVSLADKGFSEAWDMTVQKTDSLEYSSHCGKCPNKSLCHSCIAMVHNECGNTHGRPDYLCRMNEAAARYYQDYMSFL